MSESEFKKLQPITISMALFYFFVPAGILTLHVYTILPILDRIGIPIFWNYLVFYAMIPMALLIGITMLFYRREKIQLGHALSLKQRFRFKKMSSSDYLWTLGLFLFMLITAGLLSTLTAPILAEIFPPPNYWPSELNPLENTVSTSIPTEFLRQPLEGNWWVLGVILVSLVIATMGEELWWRGFILPRQELAHGKHTWIIHGILWDLFHLFLPWNLIALLPGTLALAYVAQRRKSIWPAIIAHALANSVLLFVIVILGILG